MGSLGLLFGQDRCNRGDPPWLTAVAALPGLDKGLDRYSSVP